jgi:hypothetical protein
MLNLRLVGICAVAASSLLVPAPASAQSQWEATQSSALKWELGYLALSAIDAAETINCLQRDLCSEGNPIFGKHPSSTKLIAAKVGLGVIHFAIFSRANEHNPKAALRLAQVSCAVQGGVVMLNARVAFK